MIHIIPILHTMPLAALHAASGWALWGCVLFFWVSWFFTLGAKSPGCGIFFALLGAGVLALCPSVMETPVGFLSSWGLPPATHTFTLVLMGGLVSFLFALADLSFPTLSRKSFYIGLLFSGVLLVDGAIAVLWARCSYDNTADMMHHALYDGLSVQGMAGGAEIYDTDLLQEYELIGEPVGGIHAAAMHRHHPAEMLDTPRRDTTYHLSFPEPREDFRKPDNPESIEPRSEKWKRELKTLEPLIAALESRKYVQPASIRNRSALVRLLRAFPHEMDINAPAGGEGGWTALHFACAIGDVKITDWLLKHGASIDARTNKGEKPEDCVGANHTGEIRQLLQKARAVKTNHPAR